MNINNPMPAMSNSIQNGINHPNTEKLGHMLIGGVVALLLQHHIDIHEQVATLQQFFGSDEFHAALVAVFGIWNVLKKGVQTVQVAPTTFTVGSSAQTIWPGTGGGPIATIIPSPAPLPAAPGVGATVK